MHCQVKNIGRSSGRSAVASSAYRSGEKLEDRETGITHDYTQKSGVEFTEIILCKNAPEEYKDRATLWNEVQKVEKSSDARLAREWEVAIPHELSKEQAKELVHNFGQSLADEGMCVDLAIHWKEGNHHAHIMGTTRPIKENGEWGTKEKKAYSLDQNGQKIPILDENGEQKIGAKGRKMWQRETVESNDWNKTEKVEEWRERWASECNKYLSQDKQIDHRSYERQGEERIPTIHEGFVARQIEQKGGIADKCEHNRIISHQNNTLLHLRTLLSQTTQKLKEWKEQITDELRNGKERITSVRGNDERDRGTTRSDERPFNKYSKDGRNLENTRFKDSGTIKLQQGLESFSRKVTETERGIANVKQRITETFANITKYQRNVETSGITRQQDFGVGNRKSAMESLSGKVAETERGIIDLKSKLEEKEKVRELNDRFAKYRRNVESARSTGQDHRRTIPDSTDLAISELKTRNTDRRIAELTERRATEKARAEEFARTSKNSISREKPIKHKSHGLER